MNKKLLNRLISYLAYVPILYVLITFVLLPSLSTIFNSLHTNEGGWTVLYFQQFFENFWTNPNGVALRNSLKLALLGMFVCGIVGTSLAFFIHYFEFPGRRIFNILLLAPLMLPGVITVIAFSILYGESGFVTYAIKKLFNLEESPYRLAGLGGILFIIAYTQYVYFYLTLSAAIRKLSPSLSEAAASLGASKIRIFFTVTLPLLRPAFISAAILTFMFGMVTFSAPYIIGEGYRVLSTQIYISRMNSDYHMAATQAVILASISVSFLLLMKYYESQKDFRISTKGVSIHRSEIRNPLLKVVFIVFACLITGIVILPVVTILVLSFVQPGTWTYQIYPSEFGIDSYKHLFSSARVLKPLKNSLIMVSMASVAHLVLGTLMSYIIVKSKLKIKIIVDILAMLPWALPGTVVAINLIIAFNQPNIMIFNRILVGSYIILPIAFFVMKLPLMIRSVTSGLRQLDDSIEEASRSLGASWFYTFRKVTIPLILPSIIAGGLLTFVTSMGDFTASIMLYTPKNRPLSVAMVDAMEQFDLNLAATYGAIQIVITFCVITFVNLRLKDSQVRI